MSTSSRRRLLDAAGAIAETREELAYESFAYAQSAIGSMADLQAATVDDVAAFFKTYYAPNNAVVAIVGDVETRTALQKMRKYFEHSRAVASAAGGCDGAAAEGRAARDDRPEIARGAALEGLVWDSYKSHPAGRSAPAHLRIAVRHQRADGATGRPDPSMINEPREKRGEDAKRKGGRELWNFHWLA